MPLLAPGLPRGAVDLLWHFPGQLWAPRPRTWGSTEDRRCTQSHCKGDRCDWALPDAKLRGTPGCGGHGGLRVLPGRRGRGDHSETNVVGSRERWGGGDGLSGTTGTTPQPQPTFPWPSAFAPAPLDRACRVWWSLLCPQCPQSPWCGSHVRTGPGRVVLGHSSLSPTPHGRPGSPILTTGSGRVSPGCPCPL